MHFIRMRLQGFKSFVDPTELVIAPGLTGVVGPNGCGKSNLLEAMRWVMGETSPKSMRGDGMEDVIFAGASTRPARAWAEVALSLDNSDFSAPVEFNKSEKFDITRRITRDAGSAYKVDGKDARARDVRMLFADASTGAHSPALVRQGRISELINAKPKARRAILEDAAGIGGLYQRRHEAELKLRAAEDNLARVADVLEALEQQLASLARQARQAAKYRECADALRRAEGLLLWLRWREAEAERLAAEARLTEGVQRAARAEAEASAAARTQVDAEDALPPLREADAVAAAILQRHLVERDQIDERTRQARSDLERLEARARQLSADLEREQALAGDADGSVAALRGEAEELARAQDGHEDALAAAQAAADQAARKVEAEEETLDRLTGDAARLSARHQAAERRVQEADGEVRRAEADQRKAEDEAAQLAAAIADGDAVLAAASHAMTQAQETASLAETALARAEAERAEAQTRESDARAAAAAAAGEASALRAEAEALRKLLARDAGAEGALLDRLSVALGYEAALGAALGEDLRAPEAESGAGWRALCDFEGSAVALPASVEPLSKRVEAPPLLARRLARIGVVPDVATGEALQPSLAPGMRLVTLAGDLWRWDGWCVPAGEGSSSAAIRLKQRNRLAALEDQLELSEARAAEAADAQTEAKARLAAAQTADAAAREARRRADAARAEAEKTHGRAQGELELRRARHAAASAVWAAA
ncbi:MAG: chromosome segregation SMC family protein, partial [Pseudomonadota bacterium]